MQATLIGSKVYVFGGEDSSRRPLGDLHVLNLTDMSWCGAEDLRHGQTCPYRSLPTLSKPSHRPLVWLTMITLQVLSIFFACHRSAPETSGGGPAPRSAHVAAAYADRWLLVFGGGSLVRSIKGSANSMRTNASALRMCNPPAACELAELGGRHHMCWLAACSPGVGCCRTAAKNMVQHPSVRCLLLRLVLWPAAQVHCFNDLHVLDTQTGAWSRPSTSESLPSARAGGSRMCCMCHNPLLFGLLHCFDCLCCRNQVATFSTLSSGYMMKPQSEDHNCTWLPLSHIVVSAT